ncbi:MAG: hypothetical protein M1831_007137 [Alyxoria varia]|nr:MAG: hypothetical protein M1831_007137 [Alyxoria varia]
MSDITPDLDKALIKHGAPRTHRSPFSIAQINKFLKESYQINSRISELVSFLRSIRRPYLSTAPPPRQSKFTSDANPSHNSETYLTNPQRDAIDAEAKSTWRDIHAAISTISQAESVRYEAEVALIRKKRRKRGFGALGSWAAGGGEVDPSNDEKAEEERVQGVKEHREGVLWFLQRKLQECGRMQSSMMEIRITREMEKNKSVLSKARGYTAPGQDFRRDPEDEDPWASQGGPPGLVNGDDMRDENDFEPNLSHEQKQLFARENRDMLKHYEDRLDQVREAEKSLVEISELQSTLAENLQTQSEHIEQLVQDSESTTVDVQKGNKELKKASERRSTAKMVFYGTVGLCGSLLVMDLII